MGESILCPLTIFFSITSETLTLTLDYRHNIGSPRVFSFISNHVYCFCASCDLLKYINWDICKMRIMTLDLDLSNWSDVKTFGFFGIFSLTTFVWYHYRFRRFSFSWVRRGRSGDPSPQAFVIGFTPNPGGLGVPSQARGVKQMLQNTQKTNTASQENYVSVVPSLGGDCKST